MPRTYRSRYATRMGARDWAIVAAISLPATLLAAAGILRWICG